MKLTKHDNKNKSRIVSFAAVIALILCTVLSLGLLLPDRYARAEDEPTQPAAKVSEGIRFVQVAAGYDFAIGLTYDRKLYGWSTKEVRDTQNMQTLGDYYTYDPTEINVVFRKGPTGSNDWQTNTGEGSYHAVRTDDSIKSIAATGTTAAFVTELGYIYTWGADTELQYDVPHYDKDHYLLLRAVDEANYSWKVPYIINYYYYNNDEKPSSATGYNKLSTEQIIPPFKSSTTSLAAGEFNYIFMFVRDYPSTASGWPQSTGGDYYHTYVWGSALYNAVNTLPQDSFVFYNQNNQVEVQSGGRKIFNTFIPSSSTGNVSVVAGGYTVGINNTAANVEGGTSLQLRGRNFITSLGVTEDGSNYGVTNTTQLCEVNSASAAANITWNSKTVVGALAGGVGNNTQNGSLYGYETEKYYARQASDDVPSYSISGREASVVINSNGDPIANSLAPTRYAVSLGNDIGYGISSGKLYGWGDNEYGQLVGLTTETTTVTNKDTPTQLLSTVTNFASVAAGKQQSKANRAFQNSNPTNTLSGTAFAAGAKNDDKYISAALTLNGEIYAWSNGISDKMLTYKGYTGNKKEGFAAIYSGYGNNLYAVTAGGKLVRITVNSAGNGFDQKVYDEFYTWDSEGKSRIKIDNWEVDTKNKVVFSPSAAATKENPAPAFDTATFYVWSASVASASTPAEGEEAVANTVITNSSSGYKPLVSSNRIGDAYRIVGLTAADATIQYLMVDDLDATNYAPKFYFDSKDDGTGGFLMSPTQQNNMFAFREVYGTNNEGVGICIEPKQSSKGKNIRVDFYIARYNNYAKYSNATDGDTAIYYDYKKCSILFSIADTRSVVTYSPYGNAENGNKSNIPLLDPNNPYNSNYSIAVQNVSAGVDELIKFLTGSTTTVNDNFKSAIMTEMKKDVGFPDKAKIALGDLEYYLNSEDLKKYNYDKQGENDCVYQFMFTDRDSERVTLENREGETIMSCEVPDAVVGAIKTITVKVEYLPSSYGITGANANLTADNFGATLLKLISTDFDNRFGLYGFQYTTDGGKNYLSFKYDVLTFTAKKATGIIGYTGTATEAASVRDYNTVQNQPHATANFISYTLNKYTYNDASGYVESAKDNSTRVNNGNVVHVFSLPSLRLKGSLAENTNGQASGTKNTHETTYINNDEVHLDPALYVGDTFVINLYDYVDNIDLDTISFSFNEKADTTSLAGFSNQFKDFTGHNMRVVTLTGKTISVHPTTAAPISFTVEVQRFVDTTKTRCFKNGNSFDEKIYLTFNFQNIRGFNMIEGGAKTEYIITKAVTLDLFGDGGENTEPFIKLAPVGGGDLQAVAPNAYAALKSNIQIYGLESSEKGKTESEMLFTTNDPQTSTDKTKITITPKRSGSGSLVFSVNVYDKSLTFQVTINVSSVTELGDSKKISLIDYEYILVSDLNAALSRANSFNSEVTSGGYKILYEDPGNAIYFEDEEGNTGKPPFVEEVAFENGGKSNATIRIKASNSTTQQSKVYKMYVRYTNANVTKYEEIPTDKSIIQIVIPISSGKVKLQSSQGGDLIANIDCRHKENADWWTQTGEKLDTRVSIDLQKLLELDNTVGADKCTIFLLSADSAATQYFQYDKGSDDRTILITPKLNTPKNYELSASVYNDSDKTTKVLTFEVSVKGIVTTLPVMTDDDGIIGYGNIWLYSAAIVFGVLLVIFIIRFIVYIRRRSKQRAIIKRNQELIRLRDRMHGKANAATREQLVKSKLKMEDPKYAKMFNEMRKDKEEDTGVALVNSDLAATADKKSKKNKKKGGKKTVAELKAELAAKKAAFAATQAGGAQPVNPFATEVPIDDGFVAPDGGYGAPDGGYGSPDGGYGAPDGGYGAPEADFGAQNIDGNDIIFDASDIGDGNM